MYGVMNPVALGFPLVGRIGLGLHGVGGQLRSLLHVGLSLQPITQFHPFSSDGFGCVFICRRCSF